MKLDSNVNLYSLNFQHVYDDSKSIIFNMPNPTSPSEIGISSDIRKFAFKTFKIVL